MDPIYILSEELLLMILSFLKVSDLGKCASLNSNWKRLSEDDELWKEVCGHHWQDKQNHRLSRHFEKKIEVKIRRNSLEINLQ